MEYSAIGAPVENVAHKNGRSRYLGRSVLRHALLALTGLNHSNTWPCWVAVCLFYAQSRVPKAKKS